jgi:proline racemase
MIDSDLVQIWKTTMGPLDFAVFVVRDDAEDTDIDQVRSVLQDIAEAGEATILVVRESVFSDFRKLNLNELVALQETVEQALRERITTGVVGDT